MIRTVAALRAGVTAVAVVTGAALLLAVTAGSPLPDRIPTAEQWQTWLQDPLHPRYASAAARTVAWGVWAVIAAATAAVTGHRLRRRWTYLAVLVPRPMQTLAATVIGTATVTAAGPATTVLAAPAATTAPADTQPAPDPAGHRLDNRSPAGAPTLPATRPSPAPPGPTMTVTVHRGDSLSTIAGRRLGDAGRWPEIFALNHGRHFPQVGGTLTDPDLIYPGWRLSLPHPTATPDSRRRGEPAGAGPAGETARPQPAGTTDPRTAPADDGVTGDTPPPAPSATTSPQATTSPPAAGPPPAGGATAAGSPVNRSPQAAPTRGPAGVSVTGDGWMDLGLAFAVSAAAALVWRLRRRRYTPRPPSAHARCDDPDLTPLPAVVTQARHGLRRHTLDSGDLYEDTTDFDDTAAGNARPSDTDPPPGCDAPAPLNLPALGNPMLDGWPPAGLGLTGPGGHAAARGFLAAALAAGGVDDPNGRSQVVLPATTLAVLLGAAVTVPDTGRLTVTDDLAAALEVLEEHTLHRTRLLHARGLDTVDQLRAADPDQQPLTPILLIADDTCGQEQARITAVLAQGQRLDIHGVMLGAWPDGDTVVVAADGTTSPAGERPRHGSHPADVARLTVLAPADTAALLATLAESHTGLPHPTPPPSRSDTPPAHTHPTTVTAVTPDPPAGDTDSTTTGDAGDCPTDGGPDDRTPDTGPAPPSTRDTVTAGGPPGQACDPDGAGPDGDTGGPGVVAVQVLGRPAIIGADPGQPLRAKAMELLVYLIARDGGATLDAIVEDLVPDATLSKAPNRIHTFVYALRTALRRTGGPGTYLTHPRHRYVLNRAALDVDLWRMRDALTTAETATGPARVAALRAAVGAYPGPFADRTGYEWAEPYREAIRRQALDAHLALADALHDQPEQALAVIDTAITHDPYAEQLYQAAMRIHADLGDVDAITGRLAELTRRLAELDVEPTGQTRDLAATLTDQLRHRTSGATRQAPV